MNAFSLALGALFADPNIGIDVVYVADAGSASLVRAIPRRPDDLSGFSDARIWSETARLDLRASEVLHPRPGDRIEIPASGPGQAGEAFLIQGEPVRDRERLVWTVDLRPT